ncbi:hypothetical protein [Lactococcus lactis]|uniref:hypothetical protein n=1 Tax=Lactococcus lactis TaxID=1358 RepID=UPI001896C73A|nr:hypothetical protein [Lactococcus lactis]
MSELEKAKQIAAEAFNFKSKAYTTIEQQNEIIKVNRKAFMQILSLSSLTIPKSIAEQADKTDLDTLFKWGQQEFYQWFNHEQDEYMPIIYAYLAGKALGVDLVKVVEG